MELQIRFWNVQALFRAATARQGLRPIDIVRRTGSSPSGEGKLQRALAQILEGRGGGVHLQRLAAAAGVDGVALRDALIADALENEARVTAWHAWASEPVVPDLFRESLFGLIAYRRHEVPSGTTRAEAIEQARRVARESGHRVIVPAFRALSLLVLPDGSSQMIEGTLGVRMRERGPVLRLEV